MARRKYYQSYDDNFKATAVALSEIPRVLAKHVAESLDIHEIMLYRWRMEMRRGQIMATKKHRNLTRFSICTIGEVGVTARDDTDLENFGATILAFRHNKYPIRLARENLPAATISTACDLAPDKLDQVYFFKLEEVVRLHNSQL